jgi:hypothetical protein
MSVHHIDVEQCGAALLDRANAISEARKIGRQDRWSDFHGIVHVFSADILSESRNGPHISGGKISPQPTHAQATEKSFGQSFE